MPLSGGTAGAHDDNMHQGSAKRDVADGVAGLGSTGNVLAIGPDIELTRDGGNNVAIRERTSNNIVLRAERVGSYDFEIAIQESTGLERVQSASMKDVVSGIAGLDAGGAVLAPGSEVKLTRDGSENIEVVERTSGDIVYRWTRAGANDYECRINCGGVACIIQNDSMKDVANGIAGLDANILLSPALLPPCLEDYSNHLGATDNFTQTAVAGNGVAAADAANHEIDLTTGVGAAGYATFSMKRTYTLAAAPIVYNELVQNIVNGTGVDISTYLGLVSNWAVIATGQFAAFACDPAGSWTVRSKDGAGTTSTGITALANGDVITCVATSSAIYYFVNGTLVATHTTNLPTIAMSVGGAVVCTPNSPTVARTISIDMMGVKKWY